MKKINLTFYLLNCFVLIQAQQSSGNRNQSFDSDWFFTKDTADAYATDLNDAHWKKIDLPHDWSIEDLPNQIPDSIIGPFDKTSISKGGTGYTVGGTGWYRKKFITGKLEQNKLVGIHFDGVYMNSDVWLNGHHLGNHIYGYTPFNYDLTPYLKTTGQENVLAVKVRNEGRNSRWYSGSGIHRHVWLTITDSVHFGNWGVYITTPKVSAKSARLQIISTINTEQPSQNNLHLVTTILSPEGKMVSNTQKALHISSNESKIDSQKISLSNPVLWSTESPQLYKVIMEIKEGNKILDRVETPFGIRSISFTAKNGFLLNGKKVMLKGGCIHHDNGPLGAASIDRAEERKIEILKKNGFNAIRTSHNPPSKHLLDACDRLGMLVVDEAFDMWEKPKSPEDYHLYFKEHWQSDLDAMILRDRNHPSIIIWSIGNEVNERADSSGLRIAKQLADRVHQLDPSRPVTEAHCVFWDHPGYTWDTTAKAFALLDVGGYNYMMSQYESDHSKFPDRVMLGTESYPQKALENWNMVEKNPYVIGDFVWTAFDYIGEASIANAILDSIQKKTWQLPWPWYNAWCGDIDLIGNKKTQSYYRDVVWRKRPIAMAVHDPIPSGMIENVSDWGWPNELQSWTWPGAEGKSLQVRVFSRAPLVRLLLNGQLIGEQKIVDTSIIAVFDLPYQTGKLKAVNIINGKEKDAVEFETTSGPKHIRFIADRPIIKANRNDLSYVSVEVTDDKGQVVPYVDDLLIKYTIEGNGEIAGVGNGDPEDMSSFQQPQKRVFHGRGLVIIRPKGHAGKIILKAQAKGMTGSQITITTR